MARLRRLHERDLNYGSDGASYRVSMWDPLICGHIWTYSSATRRWSESLDPCYY
jgi:hypothetical protein